MNILTIGDNNLSLVIYGQLLSEVFPDAQIDSANSISRVKQFCIEKDHDLILSTVDFDGVCNGEWPGFVYTWFPHAKLVFLYDEMAQIKAMHDVLRSRSIFISRSLHGDLVRERLADFHEQEIQESHERVA